MHQIPEGIGQSKVARAASQNARFREKSVDLSQILLQDKLYFSVLNVRFRGNSVFANSAKFQCFFKNVLKTRVFGVTPFFCM